MTNQEKIEFYQSEITRLNDELTAVEIRSEIDYALLRNITTSIRLAKAELRELVRRKYRSTYERQVDSM